jgi:AraC-like DNA-binding protein
MQNRILPVCLFLTLIFVSKANSQKTLDKAELRFINLINGVNNVEGIKSKLDYLDSIKQLARDDKNYKHLFTCYAAKAILDKNENQLFYADSIIDLCKYYNYEGELYPKDAYDIKGDFFFFQRDYKRALKNYLIFLDYSKKYNDRYSVYESNRNIAHIKRITGDYNQAVKLQKENLNYILNENFDTINYLTTLVSLANVYNDMKLPDSSIHYNELGIKESLRFGKKKYFNHFSLNNGISLYLKEDFAKAIDSIEKYTTYFEKTKTKRNLSFAYYYCGKAHLMEGNVLEAINYFKKTDTIFMEKGNLYPVLRKNYVFLVNHYKRKKDLKSHLLYLNRLIKLDSILYSQDIYLNKELINKYDIPKLKKEKETVLKEMIHKKNQLRAFLVFIVLSLFSIIWFLLKQIKLKKLYKKRFLEILERNKNNQSIKSKKTTSINIPQEIIDDVLSDLEQFEKSFGFTNKNLTLNSLSKEMSTNTNYLSRIINHYKGRNFSKYINGLRIGYAIDRMENDSVFRKYTIKAISSEAGFKSAESFSKAFYKLKGIKPSYFLTELIKLKD